MQIKTSMLIQTIMSRISTTENKQTSKRPTRGCQIPTKKNRIKFENAETK